MPRQESNVATAGPAVVDGPCRPEADDSFSFAAWGSGHGPAALALLLEALGFARELGRSPWDFAVEIAALHRTGLTASALRWLVCKGYVEHASELAVRDGASRSFRRGKGLQFGRHTCFVLTHSGLAFAHEVIAQLPHGDAPNGLFPYHYGEGVETDLRPIWDPERRELRVGGVVVKQFKVPAANQEAILAAFEEEGWPIRVDDPLSPQPDQEPKTRLHHTINSLNRNQQHPLVRFTGDGSGQGVRWSLVPPGRNGNGEADAE